MSEASLHSRTGGEFWDWGYASSLWAHGEGVWAVCPRHCRPLRPLLTSGEGPLSSAVGGWEGELQVCMYCERFVWPEGLEKTVC